MVLESQMKIIPLRMAKSYYLPINKILLFLVLPLFWNCDSQNFNNNNPYIPNYAFSLEINTDLPAFNNLKYASNGKLIPNYGARGVIVFNSGSGFMAFDAACPNQAISSCSTMNVSGINAVCSCDGSKYNLFTGQSPGQQYPMKPYRVEVNGTIIRVYN